MSRNTLTGAAALALATMMMVGSNVWGANAAPQHSGAMKAPAAKTTPARVSLEAIHSQRLPALQAAVQRIIADLEAGHSRAALVQLKQVQASLDTLQKAVGALVRPTFVNSRCPILGNPIDPTKVTADLIRDYHGQKVAFCCAGCPAAWDKLSDAEKAAKLKAVEGPQQDNDSHAHPMGSMNMQM